MIDKELIKILACPACKADVEFRSGKIICKSCKRRYPVKNGAPIMLIDKAEEEK